jgi:CheY-like chemotaxis protein
MTKPKWILLAEDNVIDAELALRALKAEDADEVVLAADGSEALDCLFCRGSYENREAGHPALILLDLKMPKVDGLDVLRHVKGDSRLRQIPVVMFTSSREESDLIRCYELGANAYLVKPLAFADYRTVLQQVRAFWLALNELPAGDPSEAHAVTAQLLAAS